MLPLIYDLYISRKIKWGWWREPEVGPVTRFIMSWVDAIVFALVAIYFLNQFFFQNFVIPSSSLEKTLLTGDYLLVSKLSYGPRIPQTPLYMPLTQHTLPVLGCKSYLEHPHWDYRRVEGLGKVELNDIVVFNYPAGDTVALNAQNRGLLPIGLPVGRPVARNACYTARRTARTGFGCHYAHHELRTATASLSQNLQCRCAVYAPKCRTVWRHRVPTPPTAAKTT